MASKYTEEQLNSLDRETLIRLFLSQQEQLENIDHTLQLVLEQMADLKRHRFGRSSEKHETEDQMSFMEVDGKIVFFNEAEAVAAEENTQEEPESVSRRKPKKKQGKREEDLDGLPVVVVEHSMTDEELEDKFGKDGWKQLPDEVYRTGRMYTQCQIVLYEYQKTRNASHPREFLKDFSGVCVTDGYQVYHTIEGEREDLKIAGCWSHARRRFDEAVEALPKQKQKDSRAYLALTMIQAIYREEKLLKDLPAGERMIRRQLSVRPLVEAYFVWVRETLPKVPQKSKTWEGFNYSLNQEKYLKVFLDDGEVPMDNNAAEQSIRGFCIGKKNWVMIDTIAGAKSSAIIYSIAETAKANNLKPYDYFEYLLTEIPKHLDDTDRSFLDNLLPWSPGLPVNCRKPGNDEVK